VCQPILDADSRHFYFRRRDSSDGSTVTQRTAPRTIPTHRLFTAMFPMTRSMYSAGWRALDAQEAIPGLPFDLVVTHILRTWETQSI
jgi:hypothetical protein